MGNLLQDVRYGLRNLRHNSSFVIVAMLTLALGIGANTTIFSVINNTLLKPLAFPHADRLDLTRDEGAHVGFGYGRHQCVGQQLARMELQIGLPTLFRRVPTLQLAVPVEELPLNHAALAYGVYELPVTC